MRLLAVLAVALGAFSIARAQVDPNALYPADAPVWEVSKECTSVAVHCEVHARPLKLRR
jgi:hypothetical protein